MELSVLVLIVSLSGVQSSISVGPKNALKKVNDHVQLTCITDGIGCSLVDWQKVEGQQSPKPVYQSGRGLLNPENFDPKRYNISEIGGCILSISRLQISDSGRFICVQVKSGVEHLKSAVLVVVNVIDSCVSNVTSKEMFQGEGYSFDCAINIPPESLEPSDVILLLRNETNEQLTMKTTRPVVRTTLASTAKHMNITQRSCDASFLPVQKTGFDQTAATLKICSTEYLTVSFPVDDISVSSAAPTKGSTVHCSASGYPPPTFSWKPLPNGEIVDGSVLQIEGDVGQVYECTATNMIRRRVYSKNITIQVTAVSSCGSGCIALIVVFTIGGIIFCVVGALCCCWKLEDCPLFEPMHSFVGSKREKSSSRSDAGHPLTSVPENSAATYPPKKPPRTSDTPNRPVSEVQYAELRPERNPHQMQSNPVNNSSTVYAKVLTA